MKALRSHLRAMSKNLPSVVDPMTISRSAKIPYKALSFRHAIHHRVVDLGEIAARQYSSGKTVAANILTRSIVESVALLYLMIKKMKQVVAEQRVGEFDDFMMKALFGCRDTGRQVEAVNALTAIDQVERESPGIRSVYDGLCEIAHPNWDGTSYAYGELDLSNGVLRLSPKYQENIRSGLPGLVGTMELFTSCDREFSEIFASFVVLCEQELHKAT